ncbi:MAG TPA: nucleotidyl transferase AbiEii/AbiGii toxin family protein [Candidatus Acidoferrales bacterium]|nr:nucleotidyl transferase AbiEii/AbiGii toxin family protein [Candidatus Acidoferrales bacterium]
MEATSPQNAVGTEMAYASARQSADPTRRLAAWARVQLTDFRGIIFIDDFHKTYEEHSDESKRICTLLSRLIDETKGHISWILATRDALDLPLAGWLAQGDSDIPIEEWELALTREEASAIAMSLAGSINLLVVDQLFEATHGLPFAFSLALRAWSNEENPARFTQGAKRSVQRFLTEEIFARLDHECRDFLLATAFFRELDVAVLKRAGLPRAAVLIDRLAQQTALISQESEGVFRQHDLFQELVQEQLIAGGATAVQKAYMRARDAYEGTGDIIRALDLACRQSDVPSILRMLRAHVVMLLEQGQLALVKRAADSLAGSAAFESAIALFARAYLERMDNRVEHAIELLRTAIQRAHSDPDLVLLISTHLALQLAGTYRYEEAAEVLEGTMALRTPDSDTRLLIDLFRLLFRTQMEREKGTSNEIADLYRASMACTNTRTRYDVLQFLAIVASRQGRFHLAREYATEQMRLAEHEAQNIVVGGGFALKHYHSYRPTFDIDAWWRTTATPDDRAATLVQLRAIAQRVAGEHGLTYEERARASSDVVSLELLDGSKKTFSFQIASRTIEIDPPIVDRSPWSPIPIETLRENLAGKMQALVARGAPRDFQDIYAVTHAGIITVDEAWGLWELKNPTLDRDAAKLQVLKHLASIEMRRPLDDVALELRDGVEQARLWIRDELASPSPGRLKDEHALERGDDFER